MRVCCETRPPCRLTREQDALPAGWSSPQRSESECIGGLREGTSQSALRRRQYPLSPPRCPKGGRGCCRRRFVRGGRGGQGAPGTSTNVGGRGRGQERPGSHKTPEATPPAAPSRSQWRGRGCCRRRFVRGGRGGQGAPGTSTNVGGRAGGNGAPGTSQNAGGNIPCRPLTVRKARELQPIQIQQQTEDSHGTWRG